MRSFWKWRGWCAFVLWLCPCLGGKSASPAKPVSSMVEEIFELDGTASYLAQIREVYLADVYRQEKRWGLSEQQVAQALQWIEILFGDGTFAADYRHGFAEDLDEVQAKTVLAWLRSPQVQRFQELEKAANRPDGLDHINEYLNSQEGRQAFVNRGELLKRYADTIQCPQRNLQSIVMEEMSRQVILNRTRPPEQRWGEEDFKERAREIRERQREGIANGCWMPLLYAFREVSDEELRGYHAFFESEAGQWYAKAHHSGSLQAWSSGGARLGDAGFLWLAELDQD